jgi:hypothetical protein
MAKMALSVNGRTYNIELSSIPSAKLRGTIENLYKNKDILKACILLDFTPPCYEDIG